MTFAQRRNRLTTHFSERIPVVKRRMTIVISNHYMSHNRKTIRGFLQWSYCHRYKALLKTYRQVVRVGMYRLQISRATSYTTGCCTSSLKATCGSPQVWIVRGSMQNDWSPPVAWHSVRPKLWVAWWVVASSVSLSSSGPSECRGMGGAWGYGTFGQQPIDVSADRLCHHTC